MSTTTEPGTPSRAAFTRSSWVVAVGWLVFVVLTLGTSLAGLQVFASTELLQQWAPWDPGTAYEIESRLSRDIVDSLNPAYAVMAERLAAGDIPGWTSLTGPGQPLASAPNMPTLNPVMWPYLLLPLDLAPGYVKLLQLGVGALGMVLLLRRWGARGTAGLLAGLVYATSGFFVSWANFPQASVAAFLPLLFWSVERYVQVVAESGRSWWVRWSSAAPPVALVVFCLFAGGFPAVAAWSLYFAGAYTVVRLWARPVGAALVRLAGAGAGVLLGAALAAVQLLPFLNQLARTDLGYRDVGFTLASPLNSLLTVVFPRVLASDQPPLFAPPVNSIEFNSYLGSAAVLLGVLAVVLPRPSGLPRGVLSYLVAAAGLCVVLIWFQNPLVAWIGYLPVFDGNPIGRLRAVLFVLATALAGLGLDAVLRGARPSRRVGLLLVGGLAAALAGAGALSVQRLGYLTGEDTAAVDTAVAVGGVVLVGLVLLPRFHRVALPVVTAVVTVQAVLGTSFYWNTSAVEQFYPQRDSLDYLVANQGFERAASTRETMRPSTNALYGIRLLDAHVFAPEPWLALLNGLTTDGIPYNGEPTVTQLPTASADQAASPGLDRLAVKHLVTGAATPVIGSIVESADLGAGQAAGGGGEELVTAAGAVDLTAVEPGTELSTTIAPAELRALAVFLDEPTPDAPGGARLSVEVTDADGADVASAARTARSFGPGWNSVALAAGPGSAGGSASLTAEHPGPWTVDVGWDGPAPLEVAVTGAGAPALQAVTSRPGDGLRMAYSGEGLVIYERTSALPRFRWASEVVVAPSEAERVELVARTELDPDVVVLGSAGAAAEGLPAEVLVDEDSGDTLRADVDAEGAGYLVVADYMAPEDWSVTVDGAPAELVVADQALAAVPVPAGQHTVEITYTPAGQTIGAALSLGSLVVLVLAGASQVLAGAARRGRGRARR